MSLNWEVDTGVYVKEPLKKWRQESNSQLQRCEAAVLSIKLLNPHCCCNELRLKSIILTLHTQAFNNLENPENRCSVHLKATFVFFYMRGIYISNITQLVLILSGLE